MGLSEKKAASNARYNKTRDHIMLQPSKEEGAEIRAAAASAGESVQGYCLAAIRNRMGSDKAKAAAPPVAQKPINADSETERARKALLDKLKGL